MHCLIIAAGMGSRIRDVSPSKPLTLIGGKRLIQHVIERASEGGVTDFVVVTGYEGDAVEAFLADLASKGGYTIETVRISDWEKPNGHSVLAGAARIEGRFLLSMSDHLVEPKLIRAMIEGADAQAPVTLAVDRKMDNPLVDLEDVTRVLTDDAGCIVTIGKLMDEYNAYDTGIFMGSPGLSAAIQAAIDEGKAGSLSEGMQALAAQGRAMTLDIGDAQWIDVDDRNALEQAEEWLASAPST